MGGHWYYVLTAVTKKAAGRGVTHPVLRRVEPRGAGTAAVRELAAHACRAYNLRG